MKNLSICLLKKGHEREGNGKEVEGCHEKWRLRAGVEGNGRGILTGMRGAVM